MYTIPETGYRRLSVYYSGNGIQTAYLGSVIWAQHYSGNGTQTAYGLRLTAYGLRLTGYRRLRLLSVLLRLLPFFEIEIEIKSLQAHPHSNVNLF